MPRVGKFLVICIVPAILLLLAAQIVTVAPQPSQEPQPRTNRALVLVRRCEAAGATHQEVAGLVLLLNKALRLSEENAGLTAQGEAQRRAELLAQFDQTMDRVDIEAGQLEVTVSRRTLANKVIVYASGGAAAFITAFAYDYGMRFWHRYRIKRTFEMRIFPK